MKEIIMLELIVAGMAFVLLWIFFSLRQIRLCREDVRKAAKQLNLYRKQQADVQNEEEAELRRQQVEISEAIYRSAADAYHRTLLKPMNRIPAYILGFADPDKAWNEPERMLGH